jgi:hypothetical protein
MRVVIVMLITKRETKKIATTGYPINARHSTGRILSHCFHFVFKYMIVNTDFEYSLDLINVRNHQNI